MPCKPTKPFKPMLLSNDEFNPDDLDYSMMYGSFKRDGVRAEVSNEGILGRSLKRMRNPKLQEWFKEIVDSLPAQMILEAEIHSDTLPCRTIAGICNSKDKDIPADLKLYIFGVYDSTMTFHERLNYLFTQIYDRLPGDRFELVEQQRIRSGVEADLFFEKAIKEGFEGCVLMDGRKKYKTGRVTIKEHIGFKMKPHKEEDLEIIGVTERMENLNESQTNELGQSFKRNTVDAKKGTGIAATFICKLPNGEECGVTITGSEAERKDIWEERELYVGKYAVVKSMDYGAKDKLRHPRMVGIKEQCEK